MKGELVLSGLDCDSCAKAVSRVASMQGCILKSADVATGSVTFEYESPEKLESLKKALEEAGYGVGGNAAKRGSLGRPLEVLSKIVSGTPAYAAERRIMVSTIASLLATLLLAAVVAFAPVGGILESARPYAPLLALSAFGISACYAALVHYRAFATPVSCMCGMMVGMTIGMAGGFLSGALAGAANGMLAGALVGMAVGMGSGALAGAKNGVMGVLEGLMAGLMAGTMGAMLSVMLFNDNVLLFLAVMFAAFSIILTGMSYMLLREGGSPAPEKVPRTAEAVLANVAFFLAFSAFLVWGPKSAFAWSGLTG